MMNPTTDEQNLTTAQRNGFHGHGTGLDWPPDEKIDLLRMMLRIRRFEETALKYYSAGKMGGFLHLYIGQEAIAAGVGALLTPADHVISGYRNHGHALAVGMTMRECMAELYGKATGCSKGRGGSIHFFSPEHHFWGGHGIVGGQTPLGLGLAYGLKYQGIQGAALCFMGDGAVNQGVFYESLNMASLFDLPVIYLIENNQYSMGTSVARSSVYKQCLAERGEVFNIPWAQVCGANLRGIITATQWALDLARNKSRPVIVEFDTYRFYGHSVSDSKHKNGYRNEEEINQHKQELDPIQIFQQQLLAEGLLTGELFQEISDAAKKEAEEAAKYADESPLPTPESIFEGVYYEVDHQTEAGRTGKHFFSD